MIKPDRWIRRMEGIITIKNPPLQDEKTLSYGLGSYGYDVSCANEFKIFRAVPDLILDPKNFSEKCVEDYVGDVCIIPPNGVALARTIEYFKIPKNVLGLCVGKSTYARCGVVIPMTLLEPEWEGHLTVEIVNASPLPVKIYANEGIAQVIFFQSDECCDVSYAGKKGKYQNQIGITLPR